MIRVREVAIPRPGDEYVVGTEEDDALDYVTITKVTGRYISYTWADGTEGDRTYSEFMSRVRGLAWRPLPPGPTDLEDRTA